MKTDDWTLWTLRPWIILDEHFRSSYDGSVVELLRGFETDFQNLLASPTTTERDMLKYLSYHAPLFFDIQYSCGFITRELSLGGRFKVDFLITQDEFSAGAKYIFVEMEPPHEKPYNQKGRQSAKLTDAIGQIREWKRWISANRDEARRMFPSALWRDGLEAPFEFKIIIGMENDYRDNGYLIKECSLETGIDIRPYEHLLHSFKRKQYFNFIWGDPRSEAMDKRIRNIVVSPLLTTYSDTCYRNIIQRYEKTACHLMVEAATKLVEWAEFSPYLTRFDAIVQHLRQTFPDECSWWFFSDQ